MKVYVLISSLDPLDVVHQVGSFQVKSEGRGMLEMKNFIKNVWQLPLPNIHPPFGTARSSKEQRHDEMGLMVDRQI